MAITVGSIVVKDASGNSVVVRSLTDADLAQLKQDHTRLLELAAIADAKENGGRQLAYVDYTQTANQTSMQVGTYYMVPFNSTDQFIEFDPATGKPKTEQTAAPKIVSYYTLMYKGTAEGPAADLGDMEVRLNFDDLAHLNTPNTFTGKQTITGVEQTVATIEDGEIATGKVVKEVNTLATGKAELVHLASAPQEDTAIQPNQIGFYTAENIVVE